jgi:hypothetical protein
MKGKSGHSAAIAGVPNTDMLKRAACVKIFSN